MGKFEPEHTARASEGQPASERRILVVDDLEDVRHLVTQVLRRRQYDLIEADSGRTALERLREQAVELVITDLKMPEMGGLELLEQVKALYPNIDVIVLTAYGTIQSAVHAMKNGAVDYVTKPFDIRELEDKVARCFENRARRAQVVSPIQPLVELSRVLSSQMDLADTLDAIIDLIQRVFDPACTEVALLDATLQDGEVVVRSGNGLAGCPMKRLTRDEVLSLAQREEPWILWSATGLEEAHPTEANSALLAPLTRDQIIGTLLLMRKVGQPLYSRDDAQLLHVFASQIALAMLHARTHQQVTDAFRDLQHASLPAVRTLVEALGIFDPYTHDHSERVSRYARTLATALNLDSVQIETIAVAALLHDMGKLGVGDNTLHKNGQLTEAEFDRVKLHPVMGAKILAGVEAFSHIVPLVLYHHESFNGRGYPEGLSGEQIPLGARIIAIVDAYDSMVTDRPYRAALPRREALARLQKASGTQLDDGLVQRWIEIVEDGALDIRVEVEGESV